MILRVIPLYLLAVLAGPLSSHARSRHHRHGNSKKAHIDNNAFYGEIPKSLTIRDTSKSGNEPPNEPPQQMIKNPITFRTPAAYLTTRLKLYDIFSIFFQVKTTQPDGVIFYSGGDSPGGDFFVLELYNGKPRYVFNVGSGVRTIRTNLREPINDNKWHSVSLVRPRLTHHILRVDDSVAYDNLPDSTAVHFDTNGLFFVGGVLPKMYDTLSEKVRSQKGFQGCLGGFDIDGDSRGILEHHRAVILEEHKLDISDGCEGPTTLCTNHACENGGECIQEWTSYKCDCDRTSFTGQRCEQDGIAYTFGASGGLIHYEFSPPEIHNTKEDVLALGFITDQPNAIILRIDSKNGEDYIEMELTDGIIYVVYNMGTWPHPIGKFYDPVNDGNYHVVRFIRTGSNSSLQIDNLEPQLKHPNGSQLSVFNNIGDIYVGGRKENGKLIQPFHGTVAGLVVNGLPILEKTVEGDPRVNIQGDVQLQIQPLHRLTSITSEPATSPVIVTPETGDVTTPRMQSTMGVKTTPRDASNSDDIILVDDPDCHEVDVSNCPETDQNVFISPRVTYRATPPPTTPSVLSPGGELEAPCAADDEDCNAGSGSGDLIQPEISTPRSRPGSGSGPGGENNNGDIIIDGSPRPPSKNKNSTTPPNEILVTVDFTEKPSQPPPPHRVTQNPGAAPPTTTRGNTGGKVGSGSSGKTNSIKRGGTALGMNIGLIIGIAVGVVLLLLVIAFAFYKYKSRDEGSYKMDENKLSYSYETCNTKPPPQVNGGVAKSGSNCSKSKKKDVKEWYV